MGCDALTHFGAGEPYCSAGVSVNLGPGGDRPKAGNTCFQLGMAFLISLAADHLHEQPLLFPLSFCWIGFRRHC